MDNSFVISIWKELYNEKKGDDQKLNSYLTTVTIIKTSIKEGAQYVAFFNDPKLRAQLGEFNILKLRDGTWRYDDNGGLELLSVKINVIARLEIDGL